MRAVGKIAVIKRGGDIIALLNVLRSRYNLHRLVFTHVHLAYLQMVGVFVGGDFENFRGDNVFNVLTLLFYVLNLEARHYHTVAKLLWWNVYINIIS